VLFTNCPTPSLKGVAIPDGRTPKACTHVLHQFKTKVLKNGGVKSKNGDADGSEDNDEDDCGDATSTPATPKATGTPRKRKAATNSDGTPKAKTPRGKSAKAKEAATVDKEVKMEEDDDASPDAAEEEAV
jgi:hypothetical protein